MFIQAFKSKASRGTGSNAARSAPVSPVRGPASWTDGSENAPSNPKKFRMEEFGGVESPRLCAALQGRSIIEGAGVSAFHKALC